MLERRVRGKLARTVWSGGKFGDNFKELPITIYNSVRPCHLRRRSEKPFAGFAEPERANVFAYAVSFECGRHKAEIGQRRISGRKYRTEIQLYAHPP